MNGAELAILVVGVGVIGLLYWFFFGPKEAGLVASRPQKGNVC